MGGGLIGARVSRAEDVRMLTGRAVYIDDIRPPGVLEAAVLRSPHPHARIVRVDTAAAAAHPGVFAVVTGADVRSVVRRPQPVVWRLSPDAPQPVAYPLAVGKVLYPGHGVAAVAAVDRATAEDALELVEVEYAPLAAVTTLEQALAPDAPRLHEDWPDNVAGRTVVAQGDVGAAFAAADVVLRESFRFARQMGTPLETRGVVATWDPFTARLDVWLNTQAPHLARELFAEVLGLSVDKVRVRVPDIGGGFGNKFDFYGDEVVAAVLSRAAGRPVKLVEDRRESFVATVHSREQHIDVEIAARADGTITGLRGTLHGVLGANFSTVGVSPCWTAAAVMTGPYAIPAYEMNVVAVLTNKTPYGSYRGYGLPKANFVHEHMVEALARRLGLDPHDVRRRNFVTEFPYQSPVFVYDSGRYAECLDLCLDAVRQAGWADFVAEARAGGAHVGVGYSFQNEVAGFAPSRIVNLAGLDHSGFDEAVVRIDSTGHVTVHTGQTSMGQGIHTALAQVAAHALDVPLDHVSVVAGDTDSSPYTGYGTAASRAAAVGGAAVLNAATRLRAKVLRIAAHILEASPADLVIADGVVSVAGAPGSAVSFAAIGDAAYRRPAGVLPEDEEPTLHEREVYDPVNVVTAFGCTAVLASVDVETGVVNLLGYLIAHDCGTVINPMIVEGQLAGGAVQAIGGALYERLAYGPSGEALTRSFAEYLLPTAAVVPPIGISHLETPAEHVPGGFKGAGEAGVIGGGAAIAHAVEDALAEFGVRITGLPITPPDLLAAIRAGGGR
ncbi:xanthine dehydrogenase family protein molybdopterin-binding subunit [Actinosynnema sp. NPDC047251]|uniref:Carbon-monoxide dehydrogenase n=1 Tax=Saccharothrix espanaensis (strain ATCC 51144 / DSM 44229 / JCM 9112 / NBRC 15066 / NRRL 15764) TaxID=1179773 RepID=K0K0B0_SACES|nr:xanthine dehydrogenase family protein molybdopterin-binding subunit [Saccharothrix espanaensis]CCH31766.1 Carbon-monoxide dehydrogenase [Saccharothrix espanaensis DSM 44229]